MADIPTNRWNCPMCQQAFQIPVGRTPPSRCPECMKTAFPISGSKLKPSPAAVPLRVDRANGSITAWVAVVSLLMVTVLIGLTGATNDIAYRRFDDSIALGATTNALERMEKTQGRAAMINGWLSSILIMATLLQILQFSVIRQELFTTRKLLTEQLYELKPRE